MIRPGIHMTVNELINSLIQDAEPDPDSMYPEGAGDAYVLVCFEGKDYPIYKTAVAADKTVLYLYASDTAANDPN